MHALGLRRSVVALVAAQLVRAFAWPADRLAYRRDAVDHVFEHPMVVEVGSGDVHVQRQSATVTDRALITSATVTDRALITTDGQ